MLFAFFPLICLYTYLFEEIFSVDVFDKDVQDFFFKLRNSINLKKVLRPTSNLSTMIVLISQIILVGLGIFIATLLVAVSD